MKIKNGNAKTNSAKAAVANKPVNRRQFECVRADDFIDVTQFLGTELCGRSESTGAGGRQTTKMVTEQIPEENRRRVPDSRKTIRDDKKQPGRVRVGQIV